MKKKDIHKYRILIIDFGSQYTQLIARRVRELGIYCEIFSWCITEIQIKIFKPNGIILSGGPESVINSNSPRAPQYIFNANIPVLGICYGMQVMAIQLDGKVESSYNREFGYAQVEIKNDSPLVSGIKDAISSNGLPILEVWMSHSDKVIEIPPNFINIASTETCPFAIIANERKRFYGIQFHPEVTHTRQGFRLLKRFLLDICKCETLWKSDKIIENIIGDIQRKIGNDRVILGLSGGVDSTVTAMLLHQAVGKNLTCIFVDNGLLRLNEAKQIIEMFGEHFGLNIIHVAVETRFFNALTGISEPESKRKIIGNTFIEIFNEQAIILKNIKWLAQGTIYSDIIESSLSEKGKEYVIKSHHNVGGLPKKIKFRLIEPLKLLFKDEVRKIGVELGIPYDMLYRHPFPGPGLGIRILGEVKKEYCNLLRLADSIFIEELHRSNFYNKVSQAFAVFLPIRSVGIMGDNRKYDWVIALRAIETIDFMTARWAHLPYELLNHVSNRIINEVDGISRVVYDISGKPPSTIEWE